MLPRAVAAVAVLLGAPCNGALVSSWSDLERRLPSSSIAPAVFDAATVSDASLEGKTVLFRDRNGWCPYVQRAWLALEVKNAEYVTVLVDTDYSVAPNEAGSLPRIQWSDGTSHDGSSIEQMLERMEVEFPQAPPLFPKASVTVDVVRDSFGRFDGVMPRFTKLSSLASHVFVYKIQREGKFMLEDAKPGEIVPEFKYQVALEEIDEILGEYQTGPFVAGASVSAADIWWAPFIERLAAYVPMVYSNLGGLREAGGEFENIKAWLDAMDSAVPAYACRVKGRAYTWQQVLADAHPELTLQCTGLGCEVADLPKAFDAPKVWAAYADGRAHLAPTAAQEVAARIVRNRGDLVAAAASACDHPSDDVDAAMRGLCDQLCGGDVGAVGGGGDSAGDASSLLRDVARFVDEGGGLNVPTDLGLVPSEALRELRGSLE